MDIKEAVALITKKVDDGTKVNKEAIEVVTGAMETQKKEFEAKVVELNTSLAAKDATLLEIQGEVKELKAKSGRQKGQENKRMSLKTMIEDAIEEHKAAFIKADAEGGVIAPLKFKSVANIQSSDMSGNGYQSYLDWRPGMEPTGQTRFRDLVRTITSETDFVSYPTANKPVGQGSFGRTNEQATKPQVDRDYTMQTLTLKPMAGYAIASRQSLRNIVFLQQWLPTSMMEQLLDSEDTDFTNTLVAAATGSSTTSGVTVAAERLIEFIRINIAAKYNPNGIAIDPAVWSEVLRTKPNDYSTPGVVTIDTNGNTRILGRPMYPVNWLTGRRTVVGDWTKTAIVQSEGLVMRQTDSHASLFTSNETAFLLERTEGLAIFRPDAFITAVV